jgi:hypothetical protein
MAEEETIAMPDFTENTSAPTTTWANASQDPKKRYGVGRYGVGVYGQGYLTGSSPSFTEVSNVG